MVHIPGPRLRPLPCESIIHARHGVKLQADRHQPAQSREERDLDRGAQRVAAPDLARGQGPVRPAGEGGGGARGVDDVLLPLHGVRVELAKDVGVACEEEQPPQDVVHLAHEQHDPCPGEMTHEKVRGQGQPEVDHDYKQ